MSRERPSAENLAAPADARVAVVAARFNAELVGTLLDGCTRRLGELGVTQVDVHRVPGAFELPVAAKLIASARAAESVILIGCVIRGDTAHFDFVAGEAAAGINRVAIETGVPCIFGVLTVENRQQALDRAGGSHGHAGESAAEAAVEMILLSRKIAGR